MVLPVIKQTILTLTLTFRDSKSWRASKSLYWFKSYSDFAEWVDFAYWWSCIGKGLPCSLRSSTPSLHSYVWKCGKIGQNHSTLPSLHPTKFTAICCIILHCTALYCTVQITKSTVHTPSTLSRGCTTLGGDTLPITSTKGGAGTPLKATVCREWGSRGRILFLNAIKY